MSRFLNAIKNLLLNLLVLFLLSAAANARAEALTGKQAADVEAMLALSKQSELWRSVEWRRINMYHATLGGVVSRVDDESYFLSPQGKRDPQAELEATIRGAFDYSIPEKRRQPNVCRWIARYQFLSRSMKVQGFDYAPLPCSGFEAWKADIAAKHVTLVFAAVYLNSTASMYGHSFIRLDGGKAGEYNRLNDTTVSFTVNSGADIGPMFLLRSLTGGFPGMFNIAPYYVKVREYADLENRDLWEYRTNLTQDEIDHMLAFIWEQAFTYMDYYFFDDNCALMLLASFEAARPGLNLIDHAKPWIAPLDMIKLAQEQPGLVDHIHYRPSQYNTLVRNFSLASNAEKQHALGLLDDEKPLASVRQMPAAEQARILDLNLGMLEYLRNQMHSEEEAVSISARQLKLSGMRSKIDAESDYKETEPPAQRPDEGHGSFRAGFAAGQIGTTSYTQLNLRGAYHDGLDPQSGFSPGASSKIGDLYLRLNASRIRFERLDLFDVFAPAVQTEWVKPQTIKMNVSIRREVLRDDALSPTALRIQVGAGKSYNLGNAARGYILADSVTSLNAMPSLALGPTIGAVWALTSSLRAELVSNVYWNVGGEIKDVWSYRLSAGLAWDVLNNQNNMRVNVVRQGQGRVVDPAYSFTDVQLAYFHYF